MQSIFRLPWCTDQLVPKMSDKARLDSIRATPVVEIPVLNKLKRKRASSPDASTSPKGLSSKKQRPDGEELQKAQVTHARVPLKSEREQTMSHTMSTSGTTSQNSTSSTAHAPDILKDASTSLHHGPASTMNSAGSTVATNIIPGSAGVPLQSEDAVMDDAAAFSATDVTGLTPMQQVIENQFNMQILLKHNELRLIEQELAKCQVALEQLRRCEVRPYPGDNKPSAAVSAGTGPSVATPPGYTRPPYPPPYGVTDGPYTRHYRQWLLHDPAFDATPMHSQTWADTSASRSTRYNGSARKSIGKSFSISGRPAEILQSIPNYPPPVPKDKSAPLILRRSTDNQLVKLICNNCNRGNFSSIQGFLNHCRIAHKVDYKSHDAAAIDCGRLLDEHEAANLPQETPNVAPQKPIVHRALSAVSTPFKNLVHPMNMTSVAGSPADASQRKARVSSKQPVAAPKLAPATTSQQGLSPFKPSQQAPHLSAHFVKYNLGGDLEQAIANAKQKVDLGVDEELESPDDMDSTSPSTPVPGSRTVAGTARAGSLAPSGAVTHPLGRKGVREPAPRHRPSPLAPTRVNHVVVHKQAHGEAAESPQGHSPNLSPHTADSNPGLVSDHEDDDHASASEDEAPHADMVPPLSVGRNCSDDVDIDVAVNDDLDQDGVVIRRNSMFTADDSGLRSVGSSSRKLGVGKRGK